ncbi:MAG: hypothetical protein ACOYEV_18940, partial [Candidatus Nanopelagicales bacterium]
RRTMPKATVHGGGTNVAGGLDKANEHYLRRYNETGDVDFSQARSFLLPSGIQESLDVVTNAEQPWVPASVAAAQSPYVASTGQLIEVDATAGAVTVTLPTPTAGHRLVIVKVDASANAVTLDAGASTVDGAGTLALARRWASATIIGTGSTWVLPDRPSLSSVVDFVPTIITEYTSGGVWTPNSATKVVRFQWGAGGNAGGSGGVGAPAGGGGGGAPGAFYELVLPIAAIPIVEYTVTIGGGGVGGAAVSSGTGNVGTNGGSTSVVAGGVTLILALRTDNNGATNLGGGRAGTATGAGGAGAATGGNSIGGAAGGASGVAGSAAGKSSTSPKSPSGGGGGGGINAAGGNSYRPWASPNALNPASFGAGGAAGGAGTGAGGDGTHGDTPDYVSGPSFNSSGAGGGGGGATGGNGGAGGNGRSWCAAGGGGGAALTGSNSGKGGDGYQGYLLITETM